MTISAQPKSTLAPSPGLELEDDHGSDPDCTLTRVLQRLGQISAVVVDAPCFTPSYDFSLCEGLVKNQCKVILARSAYSYTTWCASGSFELWEGFYPIAGKLSRISLPTSGKRLLKTVEHVFDMRRFVARMRALKPDVIHFQWLPVPVLDKIYLRQLRRIAPLVLTAHNTTLYHGVSSPLQGLGFRSVFQYFDAIVAHTEYSKKRIHAKGWISPEAVAVIPHGVLDYYRSLGRDTVADGAGAESRTIVFFGNIKPYKGLDVLLRAFHALPLATRKSSRLVIAGLPHCDMRASRKLSQDLGIDSQVTWKLEFMEELEVADLFRSAAVVALPYLEIDQSGVLMTAIAFETPIVASRLEGFQETIQDGVHGYLVPPGEVSSLASALHHILTSPEQAGQMRQALRVLRKGRLSWDHCAKETLKVYAKVIDSHCATSS
ncbi:MAG: glycosyltransferase family 4 protein [Acidobacteriia bacterium]|nr:glycosyltransferase family 4 protein [Terriglobia bacterium]